MADLRKHFRKLMEEVDMNYQAPVDPNSGSGLTKFAPTPASKVLKSYNVDHDFLHRALSFGGAEPNAVDQVLQAIGDHAAQGGEAMSGPAFDAIVGSFGGAAAPGASTSPLAGDSAVAPVVPEVPPAGTEDPVDDVGVEPVVPGLGASNIAGGAAVDVQQTDLAADPAGDMGADGGVEAPVGAEGEPADGVEDEEPVADERVPEQPIAS
jgi:hypothetical protein